MYGHPKQLLPFINIPNQFLRDAEKFEVSRSSALLRGYDVACDLTGILPNFDVFKSLKYLVNTEKEYISFAVRDIFCEDSIDFAQLKAVSISIRYAKMFREIDSAHFLLGDDGLSSLAFAVARNRNIHQVDVSHCHAGRIGASRLAKALKTCQHLPLKRLILSGNEIGG